jgi:hypothetical protein
LANFSEKPQTFSREALAESWQMPETLLDLVMGVRVKTHDSFTLEPYQFRWLTEAPHATTL